MAFRVQLLAPPDHQRGQYAAAKVIASALSVTLPEATSLLRRAPVFLPLPFSGEGAAACAEQLRTLGVGVEIREAPDGTGIACARHPRLLGSASCPDCEAQLCVVCEATSRYCTSCRARRARRSRWKKVRVFVLLLLLGVTLVLAFAEWRRRSMDWSHTQEIAIVLLEDPERPPSSSAVRTFRERFSNLTAILTEERRRYRPLAPEPFRFTVFGPLHSEEKPPALPEEQGLVSLFRYHRALDTFAKAIDDSTGLKRNRFDARIYVTLKSPDSAFTQSVEGASQLRGAIGLVELELAGDSVDFGLFVVAHELLHTRGATDKYGEDGRVLLPDGLAEPQRVPLYPQEKIELMTRGRPIALGQELAPERLEELRVGEKTAEEIGWSAARP